MKYGDIKLEALRIMNLNNDLELSINNYEFYINERKYQKYLCNMDNSINRAISYINSRKILDKKCVKLSDLNYEIVDGNIEVNLNSFNDFYEIDNVNVVTENGISFLKFYKNGNNLVIFKAENIEKINFVYFPKLLFIPPTKAYDEEVNISEEIARIIPYFVKFDLYQEDEPELAILAKNTFESEVENLRKYEQTFDENFIEICYSSEEN